MKNQHKTKSFGLEVIPDNASGKYIPFPIIERTTLERNHKKEQLINNFVRRISNSIAAATKKLCWCNYDKNLIKQNTCKYMSEIRKFYKKNLIRKSSSIPLPVWYVILFATKLKFALASSKAIDLFEDETLWECN